MAETAKTVVDEESTTKKGRAKRKTTEEKVTQKKRTATSEVANSDVLQSIYGQINSLKEEISHELRDYVEREVTRVNRRRRWNNFFRDVIIVAFAVVTGYFGYCLYDAHYFSFTKTECEKSGTCEAAKTEEEVTAGPVKDATWYLANYRYLFDNVQTNLDADSLEAYYLYTDDYKVSEIEPKYLLSMAYNQIDVGTMNEKGEISFSSERMAAAFKATFGTSEFYEPADFKHGCVIFHYASDTKTYTGKTDCTSVGKREIIEKIDRIYEEGEVIYIATIAAIRDKATLGLYNFDNLFKPVMFSVDANDIGLYSENLNRYQYQFKKSGEQYYLSSITKIK